ncbi:MAG: tRNA preQ1(34) S-adenosylmethionine ribosyltransferase-isomerase QueA [Phycisphaerae bacterium]|nr:tRNA preQ1(34) S-adenosylmethionine ribosyltransferase-isomerase QueA [Phycisphaerae bacterium]
MRTDELDYELPPELIAQDPAAVRSESRLLVLDRSTGGLADSTFSRLGEFLRAGDCLVLNDTKVLPARFFARRRTGGNPAQSSGGALEGLFLHETPAPGVWAVMLKGARKVKLDEIIEIKDRSQRDFCPAKVVDKKPDGVCLLEVQRQASAESVLNEVGFPPLPPYIRRNHDLAKAESDLRRYQTVYARCPGAVAAPTAGLHFTDELMAQLKAAGIEFAYVTLHVGAGTFKPIATEQVEEHEIHHEWYRLNAANADAINAAHQRGGRIVAVGTTVTRVLETVANVGWASAHADDPAVCVRSQHGLKPILHACEGTTNLFITPGYKFMIVDAMITNFHLPRSTLLALVGAFASLERMRAAYRHAIEQRYRFYSYGDAMLIA